MNKYKILWTDDEIEILKPHILFLQNKNYDVITAVSGDEALEIIHKDKQIDVVLLDENMPGLSGLDTLQKIKQINASIPVIMITKSEEEHIMDSAIGRQIADYLIKPINPNQVLLSLKKVLENKKLITETTTQSYRQEFIEIMNSIQSADSWQVWRDVYKKIVFWELQLDASEDKSLFDVLYSQKQEANKEFAKFIEKNYMLWLHKKVQNVPTMSHTLIKNKFINLIHPDISIFFILIDNLRYDQWKIIEPILAEYYKIEEESLYYSILPTTTQYARNALFAGLLPSEIEKTFPQWWSNDEDEGGKNLFEEHLFQAQLKRLTGKDIKFSFNKVTNHQAAKKLIETIPQLTQNPLNVIVYNFVDMLSHARTEMEIIKELAEDEPAYRSITKSWFLHSPLFEIIKLLQEKKVPIIITTDHGTVHVKDPIRVLGDRNVNTNLRYKQGKALEYNSKEVVEFKNPSDIFLPKLHPSSRFIFAKEYGFFVYPNNYGQYVNLYKNTFQHGGISLEEMIIPFLRLIPR
ncbi:MAG: two-component system response regulator [Bacteroidia bacterium]|nr:MAG: two-component system response regulator [Bacteroidia bacterium]